MTPLYIAMQRSKEKRRKKKYILPILLSVIGMIFSACQINFGSIHYSISSTIAIISAIILVISLTLMKYE